jgi:hypothetical protein
MLKMNKEYANWENDWRSTKYFRCVCTIHNCELEENEEYLFRRHVDVEGGTVVAFDEDEIDLSGMDCPRVGAGDIDMCDDFWEAREVIE